MKIERWSMVSRARSHHAPEIGLFSLCGRVYGHPSFDEGHSIITSAIVKRKGDSIVTESNSVYELGEVDPEYEKLFPNAKERLLAQLHE